MKRMLSMFAVPLLPIQVWADGKVIPPIAFPAKVTIPDQRALIHFTNGLERLVIETHFTGSGTNFAWVIPLPSQPVIEEATTGLFPTLQYLFRPQIEHKVPKYYVAILLAMALIVLLGMAAKSVWHAALVCLVCLLVLLVASLFLPTLGGVKTAGIGLSPTASVAVLDRASVGVFETATIASRAPWALQTWLRENGFALSQNVEPAIESYVKDGWVFVAAKIRRDRPDLATSRPHPLSLTFKTDRPVYPLRLTGVDNGPIQVELYVFGESRAEAPFFKVERCARPTYPAPPEHYQHWLPKSWQVPTIVHPLLRKWVEGSPAATKLTATLKPSQMRQDVWLRWSEFREKKHRLFSHSGALTCGLNYGAGLLALGLLAVYRHRAFGQTTRPPGRYSKAIGAVVFSSALLAAGIYHALPKTNVRLAKYPFRGAEEALHRLHGWLLHTNPVTRPAISAEARRLIASPTEDMDWVARSRRYGGKGWDNFLLGGQIREEDSPGNFTFRERGNDLEFVVYDALGAEHVMNETWRLQGTPASGSIR